MPPANPGNPADNPHVLAFSLLKALGAAMAPDQKAAQQFVLAGKSFPKLYEKARRAIGAVPDLDAASQEAVAALLEEAKVLQAGAPSLSLEQALLAAYEGAAAETAADPVGKLHAPAKAPKGAIAAAVTKFNADQPRDNHGQWTGSAIGAGMAAVTPAVIGRYGGRKAGAWIGRHIGGFNGAMSAAERMARRPAGLGRRLASGIKTGFKAGGVAGAARGAGGKVAAAVGRRMATGLTVGRAAGAALGAVTGGRLGLILGVADGALALRDYIREHSSDAQPKVNVSIGKSLPGTDLEQGLVWGWASISDVDGQPVIDHQGDTISEADLQAAAHDFIKNSRTAGIMHSRDANGEPVKAGEIIESVVMTRDLQKSLGIDLGKVGWLICMKLENEAVRKAVADGTLKSFSIGGQGRREEIETAG